MCCMNAARLTSEMLQTPVNRCSSLVMHLLASCCQCNAIVRTNISRLLSICSFVLPSGCKYLACTHFAAHPLLDILTMI